MITHEYQFRVAYPDTDQMGTMHHANYVKYYELARWELFRSIGVPYNSIEEAGVMCPVIRMNFRFVKTTRYVITSYSIHYTKLYETLWY